MTKEELIKHLEHLADYVKYSEDAPALREVIEMLKCSEMPNGSDTIYRQAAIDAICDNCDAVKASCPHYPCGRYVAVEKLPSAQQEPHEIGYSECANAMLKMWIDNVLTDGEYSRIMDKLNARWAERKQDATH